MSETEKSKNDVNLSMIDGAYYMDKLYPFYIATSHFESLELPAYRKNRQDQLHDTFNVIFKNEANCVVLGDYNFDGKNAYQKTIKNYNFVDVIENKFVENDDEDFSFSMPKTNKFPKWRPDKICMPVITEEQKAKQ